ncbi:hypothetical protein CFC21_020741 [Triticum aestivum]|uniref:DUF1618 domain-containing protein n=3 Tax=Triticum TaxID=4564 RepID=A0A9R1RFZ2_TRITD|nr:uncharacterized protein LOC123043127 [Triticum aestivum]KAF7005631.1 hypothetical protein CFC21_020741 [Triticum aestivum]VAH40084.1 unnamed protein product [Triticum turgidum subsp. durum]
MAPPMVLLDREIEFRPDPDLRGFWGDRGPQTRDAMTMSDQVMEYLRTFKARAVVHDPPKPSFLDILVPPLSDPLPPPYMGLDSGRISSTDKNLVALYAGGYRPGSSLPGGYLIYDACNDSLSVIPRLPDDDSQKALGHQSAVVMCDSQGQGDGYLLAELVVPGLSRAEVWLWKSSASEWALLSGSHPLPSRSSSFSVDSCFSYRGSTLCWVDLFQGILLCHLNQDYCNSKFSFIHLPPDCPTYDVDNPDYPDSARSEESRSVACVCDHIKLIALDECGLELIVWTQSPQLSGWTRTSKYNVEQIWANVNYMSAGLTKLALSLPVLSIHQDDVVFLVVNDDLVVDRRLVREIQYLLRVDMKNNHVQVYPQPTWSIYSQLLASEFSVYRRQDHPREIEASEFGKKWKEDEDLRCW